MSSAPHRVQIQCTIRSLQVEGKRKRGHPRKTSREELVEGDLIDWGVSAEDALDKVHWKSVLCANYTPSETRLQNTQPTYQKGFIAVPWSHSHLVVG